MKKIILLLLLILLLASCSEKHTFTEDDGRLICDERAYYPLENSHRYSDLGLSSKIGEILGSDIYSVKNSDHVLYVGDSYYVTEEYKDLDVVLEDCGEFFFVNRIDLDKNGRINKKQLSSAEKLTDRDAVDFAFYLFYGREPKELGYVKGEYEGELIATFISDLPLVSSYPVYKWSGVDYSVEVDGVHYMLEEKWSKKIGIIN